MWSVPWILSEHECRGRGRNYTWPNEFKVIFDHQPIIYQIDIKCLVCLWLTNATVIANEGYGGGG